MTQHVVQNVEEITAADLARGLTYGIVAEFEHAEDIIAAARQVRKAGYTRLDAYSPFPVHGLDTALGFRDVLVPWVMFAAGVAGAAGGFALINWTTMVAYPLNIGGRPLFSWPSWIPITFECTVLLAALAGVVGMIALNGLPMPYHPVFSAPNFERATSDRFFLAVEATDPKYDRSETVRFLESLNPVAVTELELRK